jgi:hypothetical protein
MQKRQKTSINILQSTHVRLWGLARRSGSSISGVIEKLVGLGEAIEGLEESDRDVVEKFLERIRDEQVTEKETG